MTSEHQNPSFTVADDSAIHRPFSEDEYSFDLKRFLHVGWSYRRVCLFALAGVVPLYLLGVLGVYIRQPVDRFARVRFDLRFDGVNDGRYPNGIRFNESDIVADPVLKTVFDRNQLQRYGSFEDVKGSLFVMQTSTEREVLDNEYRTRLNAAALTAVDRRLAEEEYRRRLDSLKNVGYSINFRGSDSLQLPTTLQAKLLLDVLNEWAAWAVGRKGVLQYEIPMPSAVFPRAARGSVESTFSVVEALRRRAMLVIVTIDRVMLLPGASFVRAGELKASLTDIRSAVDDLLDKIEPLASQAAGAPGVDRLVRDELLHATIAQNEATAMLKSLQDTLRAYDSRTSTPQVAGQSGSSAGQGGQSNSGFAPQVSESFLDRLVQLTKQASDEKYRQELTDRILVDGQRVAGFDRETEYVKGLLAAPRQSSALSAEATEAGVRQIEKQLSDSIKDLEAAYEDLSRNNLNPSAGLFSVTSPVVTSAQRAFGLRQALLYGAWVVLVTLLFVVVGCGLHAYTTGRFDSEARAV